MISKFNGNKSDMGYILDLMNDNLKYHISLDVRFKKYVKDFYEDAYTESKFKEDIQNAYRIYLVKFYGKVIGFASIKHHDDNTLSINEIYLDAKYRKMGYGKKLVEFALNDIKHSLFLSVLSSNTNAINFYKHMGFIEVDRETIEEGVPIINMYIDYNNVYNRKYGLL